MIGINPDTANQDLTESLCQRVEEAQTHKTALRIQAGGSKTGLSADPRGEILDLSSHRGVVEYQPTELVLTARAGTPLSQIEAVLAREAQMLGFEPPHYGASATLGGTIACGLSGPRRPFAGSVRDHVLGVRMINGLGQDLRFGGTMMKNVAGFDVSRLMVGAMGTLGVLLEISIKVLPRPEAEMTLVFEHEEENPQTWMNRMIAAAWPISGACHLESQTFLRLSGATEALQQAHRQLGGEILSSGDDFWTALREQTLPFFQGPDPLWRCSVPPMAANPPWPAQVCMDWVGGLRWLKSAEDAETIHRYARDAGGHARCIRGHEAGIAQNFASLSHPLLALHQRVKQAFDPAGILNPGGLFPGW